MSTTPRHRRPRHRGTRIPGRVWLAGLALCIAWTGCSVEKYYSTLSFFFDGVPNPDAKARAEAEGGITEDIRKSPTFTQHKPFADDNCAACHTNQFQLTNQDSSICLKCHADRTTQYPRMHGPVAAVACLWCHAPHETAEAHLLKRPARQVCTQCHEGQMLNSERVPAHADDKRSCLDCHSGHGGDVPFFLREGVAHPAVHQSAPAPAVEPAPTPDAQPQPKGK